MTAPSAVTAAGELYGLRLICGEWWGCGQSGGRSRCWLPAENRT